MNPVGRFAPSTTGDPHPGTLMAALLVWLDARAVGGRARLRLEDLDPDRATSASARALVDACGWLGLDWDGVDVQSGHGVAHGNALDQLAAAGRLYPCACSRAARSGGRRAPDGGWAYENVCRGRGLPPEGWRAVTEPLRVRLDDVAIDVVDEGGEPLSQAPARAMGDPVVRRRDGAVAYQLAVVVDDAAAGITRVVRGRDIAPSTATQVALQRLLGLPTPSYRHHFLLLEACGGDKLAKLHGSIGFATLRAHTDGPGLCGWLAHVMGLRADASPITPVELLRDFDWARIRRDDVPVRWDPDARRLRHG